MGKVIRRGGSAREKAVEIVRAGGSFEDAAGATGYCANYVRQLCTKAGVHTPKYHKGINKAKARAEEARANKKARYEAMRSFKAEGHTHKETAEKFGVSTYIAIKVCKGIAPQEGARKKGSKNQYSKDQTERVSEIIRVRHPGFEFAGNYTGSQGHVDVRCLVCGDISTRNWHNVRVGESLVCSVCAASLRRQRNEEKRQRIEEERRQRQTEAEDRKHKRLLNAKAEQISFKMCPVCGGYFLGGRKYCSEKCAHKVADQRRKDKRLRLLHDRIVDNDITLEGLAKRDGDICWLCGRRVDWSDYDDQDGVFIAKDLYPSIDHVVPLARGGRHEWANVKLAHRICNSIKSDTVITPVCADTATRWRPMQGRQEKYMTQNLLDLAGVAST